MLFEPAKSTPKRTRRSKCAHLTASMLVKCAIPAARDAQITITPTPLTAKRHAEPTLKGKRPELTPPHTQSPETPAPTTTASSVSSCGCGGGAART